ncbi:MAG: ribonuclease P protein component [Candidatus Cyclobacteriaceae bacterium M2_1C_046]
MIRHTFTKAERLKSQKIIKELFLKGSSFYSYPIKIFYLPSPEEQTQVMFAVPKKKIKKAVDRNRIKRRMREAYRLNKLLLSPEKCFYIGIVYIADKQEEYQIIETKLKKLIQRLVGTKIQDRSA